MNIISALVDFYQENTSLSMELGLRMYVPWWLKTDHDVPGVADTHERFQNDAEDRMMLPFKRTIERELSA